jgi:hypothetical protein
MPGNQAVPHDIGTDDENSCLRKWEDTSGFINNHITDSQQGVNPSAAKT